MLDNDKKHFQFRSGGRRKRSVVVERFGKTTRKGCVSSARQRLMGMRKSHCQKNRGDKVERK